MRSSNSYWEWSGVGFVLCHLDIEGRGIVGTSNGDDGGDPVTQLQHIVELSAADVNHLWVHKDRPVLDD